MIPYYDDGTVVIYNADARDVLPTIEANSIGLVLTDPPYGHNNNDGDLIHNWENALGLVKSGAATAGDARPIAGDGYDEANSNARMLFEEARRVLVPGGCCCCCCGGGGGPDPQFARWSMWLDELLGFKHAVVWDKGGLGMGWHYRRNYEFVLVGQKPGAPCKWYGGRTQANVVRVAGIKPSAQDHPTPKPVELMGLFIDLHGKKREAIRICGLCGKERWRPSSLPARGAVSREWRERNGFCTCRPPQDVKLTRDEHLAVEVLLFDAENRVHEFCGDPECRICNH